MAFNALKETKIAGLLARLTQPISPSRRASHIVARPAPKSKLLSILDAELVTVLGEAQPSSVRPTASGSKRPTMNTTRKPTYSFFSSTSPHSQERDSDIATRPSKSRTRIITASVTSGSAPDGKSQVADKNAAPEGAVDIISAKSAEPAKSLPLYSYKSYSPEPAVVYTRHYDEANELVEALQGPLGFDMEWRVFMQRSVPLSERRTALIQVCDEKMILLIQVSAMDKFPSKLKELIESRDRLKCGANIRNDGVKLCRDYEIEADGLVELGTLAHKADPAFHKIYKRQIVSLAKVVEMYTSTTLDKGKVRISNWEAIPLQAGQITYAANDAHCALMVYKRLYEIAAENKCTLDPSTYISSARSPPPIVSSTGPLTPKDTSSGKDSEQAVDAVSKPTSAASNGSSSSSKARPLGYATNVPQGPRPQHMRAYKLWHIENMPLNEICATLRSKENPLRQGTVITYVVGALQADPSLPFSIERLKAFAQLEIWSWRRHRAWITEMESKNT